MRTEPEAEAGGPRRSLYASQRIQVGHDGHLPHLPHLPVGALGLSAQLFPFPAAS